MPILNLFLDCQALGKSQLIVARSLRKLASSPSLLQIQETQGLLLPAVLIGRVTFFPLSANVILPQMLPAVSRLPGSAPCRVTHFMVTTVIQFPLSKKAGGVRRWEKESPPSRWYWKFNDSLEKILMSQKYILRLFKKIINPLRPLCRVWNGRIHGICIYIYISV